MIQTKSCHIICRKGQKILKDLASRLTFIASLHFQCSEISLPKPRGTSNSTCLSCIHNYIFALGKPKKNIFIERPSCRDIKRGGGAEILREKKEKKEREKSKSFETLKKIKIIIILIFCIQIHICFVLFCIHFDILYHFQHFILPCDFHKIFRRL